MKDGLIILLVVLFFLEVTLDWIQFKEELREMWGDEVSEQREDDGTGATSENQE